MQNPHTILGLNKGASKDDIKKAYKEIALSCHPDKLVGLSDAKEKENRIEKFKQASVAYEILMNNNCNTCDYDDKRDWKDIWNTFFDKESLKETFVDIANMFIQSKVYPKSYYNPSSNLNKNDIAIHNIKLQVSYLEVLRNAKKKLRLILVDIEEPIFIDILCGSFPQVTKEYFDDNDIQHDIVINMEFVNNVEGYDHIISKDGSVDLVTTIEVSLYEYITGYTRSLTYIDGTNMTFTIPPFQKQFYEIHNKGLKKGSLIVNIFVKNIEKDLWDKIQESDKVEMIRILSLL